MRDERIEMSKKEKRHKLFSERLESLDRDLQENKERLYIEALATIKLEMRSIIDGTHQEYRERVELLEHQRKCAIDRARMFRDYQIECANALYRSETENCNAEYHQEKTGLRERILGNIDDKKRKYREDRENFIISNDFSLEAQKGIGMRKTRAGGGTGKVEERREKRQKKNGGPQLPLTLKDSEVLDDMKLLGKGRR
ncbi:hypothetical protein HK101_009913 [Irineochytrium annulatum]|nr:hypothetical protein HK101_009913 [Irineochytrium annulatum]